MAWSDRQVYSSTPSARSLCRTCQRGPSITSAPSVIIHNPDTPARTAEKKPFLSLPHYLLYLCVYVRAPGRCRDERLRGHQLRTWPHLCWEMERQPFQRMVNDARCWDSGESESFGGLGNRASLMGQFGRNHFILKLTLWARQAVVFLMTLNAAAKKTFN